MFISLDVPIRFSDVFLCREHVVLTLTHEQRTQLVLHFIYATEDLYNWQLTQLLRGHQYQMLVSADTRSSDIKN